jgi:hypothetical protein
LQRAFPLDVLIVPSSAITVAADGERLTCGGFTLGETIRLVTFKFIADYFDDLSLSPIRGDLGAAFMSSSHSGTPSPWWAMIEDSVEEFLMVSSRDVGFGLPSPRRRGRGVACSHHNHNMDGERSGHSSHDDGSTADGGATVEYQPPSSAMPHLARGSKRKPVLGNTPPSKRQRHGEASSPASKPLPRSSRMRHHAMSPRSRRRGSRWWTLPPLKLGARKWLPQLAARGGGRLRPLQPSP